MNRLLEVEMRRLLSRRVVRMLFLLCVIGILIAGITVFVKSSDQPGVAGTVGESAVQTEIQDPAFHLVDVDEILGGTSVPLIILAWVIGATAIGAEWQRGTLQTTLTWEPRRIRLIGAKLAACALVIAAGFIFLELLLALALLPAAVFRGTTSGADAEWLLGAVGVVLRGGAVAVFASAVGFAIATVGRNTAAALGVGFLYISVIEGLVRGLRPQLIPWLVADNAAVFITAQPEALAIVRRTTAEAGVLLLFYALALCVLAVAFFRARDVT